MDLRRLAGEHSPLSGFALAHHVQGAPCHVHRTTCTRTTCGPTAASDDVLKWNKVKVGWSVLRMRRPSCKAAAGLTAQLGWGGQAMSWAHWPVSRARCL